MISEPEKKLLRVYEMPKDNKFELNLKSQYKIDSLSYEFIKSLHNVITPMEGVLILFNDKDMCVCDLEPAIARHN